MQLFKTSEKYKTCNRKNPNDSLKNRRLHMENLEERQLLSVTPYCGCTESLTDETTHAICMFPTVDSDSQDVDYRIPGSETNVETHADSNSSASAVLEFNAELPLTQEYTTEAAAPNAEKAEPQQAALENPKKITLAANNTNKTIKASWDAVKDAAGYEITYTIYIKADAETYDVKPKTFTETLAATDTSFTIQLVDGASMDFQLKVLGNGAETTDSEYSEVQTATLTPISPANYYVLVNGVHQSIFELNSNPDATFTIYLDFTGNIVMDSGWNKEDWEIIISPSFIMDQSLSTTEMYSIWQSIAEDYAPFNVNVTTEFPGLDNLNYSGAGDVNYGVRVSIGGNSEDVLGESCGGIAFLESFQDSGAYNTCFAFPDGTGSPKGLAMAASHEVGHTLGLHHDGIVNGDEYYDGNGIWGSLMGAPYSRTLTQWNNGTYVNANNTEDDLSIIAGNFYDAAHPNGLINDGHVNAVVTNEYLPGGITVEDLENVEIIGVFGEDELTPTYGTVEFTGNADVFQLDIYAGDVNFAIQGCDSYGTVLSKSWQTNLDIKAMLFDSNWNLVDIYDNTIHTGTLDFNAAISAALEESGTYYLVITGDGRGEPNAAGFYETNNYSNYGSLGRYVITGTAAFRRQTNEDPVAVDDSFTVNQGNPNNLNVLANDSDPDGDPITITNFTLPEHGTLELVDGIFIYTPEHNYVGPDSFTYTITDDYDGSDTATVTLNVINNAPVAVDDTLSVDPGSTTEIDVLANDSDPDHDIITLDSVTAPSHGTVSIVDGKAVYAARNDYAGADSFTYTISDELGASATATVRITVLNCADFSTEQGGTLSETAVVRSWGVTISDVIIENKSLFDSEGVKVSWYASADTNITSDDIYLGANYIESIKSGSSETLSRALSTKDLPEGTYYIGWILESELDRALTNNTGYCPEVLTSQYQLLTPEISARCLGTDSVQVTLAAVSNASSYAIEYSRNANFENSTTVSASVGANVISNLESNTSYYFRSYAIGTGLYATSIPTKVAVMKTRMVNDTVVTTLQDVTDETDGVISLREALANAWDGETVSFAAGLSGGIIQMNGNSFEINQSLHIDASMLTTGITLNASSNSRIFTIQLEDSQTVSMTGLTFLNGRSAGGGAILCSGTLSSVLALNDCVFTGNSAYSGKNGGAILNEKSSLQIDECFFSQNTANFGGAIASSSSVNTLNSCDFAENKGSYGGAVYVTEGVNTLVGVTFTANTATSYGAGIYASASTNVLEGCIFKNNVGGYSAALDAANSQNEILNSIFVGNRTTSTSGGTAIRMVNSQGTKTSSVINTLIAGNEDSKAAAAVYIQGANNITFINSTVANNGKAGFYLRTGKDIQLNFYNSIVAEHSTNFNGDTTKASINAWNTLSYGIAWTNAGETGATNYVQNPSEELFRSLANDDYTPVSTSQAIDTGQNTFAKDASGNALTEDVFGRDRIFNGIVDLGAIEGTPKYARDDTASTDSQTEVLINVLANDVASSKLVSVGNAAHGTVAIQGSQVLYTPNAGWNGTDSFIYSIETPSGIFDTANVTISVQFIQTSVSGTKVTVSWNAAESESEYLVQYRASGTDRWTSKTVSGTSFTFSGRSGYSYEILVTPSGSGHSFTTSAAILATPKIVKNTVSDDTFTAYVTNFASTNLKDAKNVAVTLNNESITLSLTNGSGSGTFANGISAVFQNGVLTFTNAESSQTYKIQVRFSNAFGSTAASSNLSVKTLAAAYSAPTNVQATAVGSTEISVLWNASVGKNSTHQASKYTVQYLKNGRWTTVSSRVSGTSYTIRKLTGGTEYQIRVFATKDRAFLASSASEVTSGSTATTLLSVPKITRVSSKVSGTATIQWNGVQGAESYELAYCVSGTNTWVYVPVSGTQRRISTEISGLVSGTSYDFKVQAISATIPSSDFSSIKTLKKIK